MIVKKEDKKIIKNGHLQSFFFKYTSHVQRQNCDGKIFYIFKQRIGEKIKTMQIKAKQGVK